MKLAEALNHRKQLSAQLDTLWEQFNNAQTVAEGETPEEDPRPTFETIREVTDRIRQLTVAINFTNNNTTLPDYGFTIMDGIARRDALKRMSDGLTHTAAYRKLHHRRTTKDDIKFVNVIPTADFRKIQDELAADLRKLDAALQASNWTVAVLGLEQNN